MLQSSAYRTKRCLRRSSSRSSSSSTMFDRCGESGPPCGVPSSAGLTKHVLQNPHFQERSDPSKTLSCRSPAARSPPSVCRDVPLMDVGFAIRCSLARHRRPLISSCPSTRVFAPRFFRDLTSRLGPCASLSLHVHPVVKRTFTSKLSNMLGTQQKARRV
jgi:hypothetical protein